MFDSDDDSTLFDLFAASDAIGDKYLSAADVAARDAALFSAVLDVYAVLPDDAP